jgi:hypothetical protein
MISSKIISVSFLLLVVIINPSWAANESVNSSDKMTRAAKTNQTNTQFVTQILEPFGGKILMPKDWYYRERHGGPSYIWILSKENPDKGPYITGVKLQYLAGITEGTGKIPEQFLQQFVQQKSSEVEVLSSCEAEEQEFFTRICLETLEPATELGGDINYRIQYSLFWSNEMDMAVIMVHGTLEDNWEETSTIFAAMKDFEMIDMTRFEE